MGWQMDSARNPPGGMDQVFLDLNPPDREYVLNSQIGVVGIMLPGAAAAPGNDRSYSNNEELWADVLIESIGAGTVVTLRDTYLFEWFPRSPGLFHTAVGADSRQEALRHTIEAPGGVTASILTEIPPQARSLLARRDADYVFDHYGKSSMLRGGIGCFRIKPRTLKTIGHVSFMGASSSGIAHEGFLVALRDSLYNQWIDSIRKHGAIRCSLTGRLQSINRKDMVQLFEDYTGVPQVYLLVEELRALRPDRNVEFTATGALSFQSDFEGSSKMYASYATFHPGRKGSLDQAVDWLADAYVHKLYRGRVRTDFDEVTRRFEGATFTLSKIFSNQVDLAEARQCLADLHLSGQIERLASGIAQAQFNIVSVGAGASVTGNLSAGGSGNRQTFEPARVPGIHTSLGGESRLVLSLHGIRTRGVWQKQLTRALGEGGLIHDPLDYDFFRAIQLVIPFLRKRKIKWFLEQYQVAVKGRGDQRPSVIAHSFGTYLVAQTMEKYDEVKFDRIVFCGSIVRISFPWSTIFERRQAVRVLNDYGAKDFWAKAAEFMVSDAGPSGAKGFHDKGGGSVVERFRPLFRHSDYFYLANYQQNWVPFLNGIDPAKNINPPAPPANWKFRSMLLLLLLALVGLTWFFLIPRLRDWLGPAPLPTNAWASIDPLHPPPYAMSIAGVLSGYDDSLTAVEADALSKKRAGQLPAQWLAFGTSDYQGNQVPDPITAAASIHGEMILYAFANDDGHWRQIERSPMNEIARCNACRDEKGKVGLVLLIFPLDRETYNFLAANRSAPERILSFPKRTP